MGLYIKVSICDLAKVRNESTEKCDGGKIRTCSRKVCLGGMVNQKMLRLKTAAVLSVAARQLAGCCTDC